MWLIVLEAMAALGVLLFLVWWTMFSGRRRGEPLMDDESPAQERLPSSSPGTEGSSPALAASEEPSEAGETAGAGRGGQTKLKG